MLDYLNAGWDGCCTVEAYPWLPTILLGEVLLGSYGPKQSKLAGHFQCFLAVLMRNGAGKLLERISAEDGMGPRGVLQDGERSPALLATVLSS